MSVDEQHAAFPKLYKAPAYARPPAPVEPSERPFDLDELPLLAEQTPEERAIIEGALPGVVPAATLPPSVVGIFVAPTRAVAGSYVAPASAPVAPGPASVAPESPIAPAVVMSETLIPETPAVEPAIPATSSPEPTDGTPELSSRPFSLRALADRLRGRSG